MPSKVVSIILRFVLDQQSLDAVERALEQTSQQANAQAAQASMANVQGQRTSTSVSPTQAAADATAQAQNSQNTAATSKSIKDTLERMVLGETADDMSEEARKQTKYLQLGQEITAAGIKGLTSITQGSFNFLEMIYNQLKSASPLLQTIETLFNLAVQLFFMPLGNKLAEVMLPAVLDLVDNVTNMWDAMENMSLSQMIDYMMQVGVTYFAQFFQDLGDALSEQGGILGSIGSLLSTIGDFLQNSAYGVLNAMLTVVNLVVGNLKEIISLIVAFYSMQYTMQLMAMYVNAAGQSIFNKLSGGALALAMIGTIGAVGIGAGLTSYGVMTGLGMAEGGYVPATDGGSLRILGEGGQGEYVIPESQMGSIGGTTNYYYFNGFTSDDVIRLIREEVSSQISESRIRGGF